MVIDETVNGTIDGDGGGFDIVIGNPPYISSKALTQDYKTKLRLFFSTATKQFDLYSLFIELSVSLSNRNGVVSYIVPDSIIGRSNFSCTRDLLLQYSVLQWLHINNIFRDADVSSLIYVVSKIDTDNNQFKYTKTSSVEEWMAGILSVVTIHKENVYRDEAHRIIFADETEVQLFIKVKTNKHLDRIMEMWRGEEIGRKSEKILLNRTNKSLPLLTGTNVQRYGNVSPTCYIDRYCVEKDVDGYMSRKLLIRQLGDKINATIDNDGCVTLQSVYNLALIDNDYDIYFILGLLNSTLYDFLYQNISGDKQLFQRIVLENIKVLPVPNVSKNIQKKISTLVQSIYKVSSSEERLRIERAIDEEIYIIFGLSEREISIISDSLS